MTLEKYLKDSKAYIWKETFAIIKAKNTFPDAFVNIIDKNEITVIADQDKISEINVIEAEKDWKIFTLDVVFPMNVTGVTAKIATCLAEHNISIMPIAAFSRDHFLIKSKDIKKATKALMSIGINLSNFQ